MKFCQLREPAVLLWANFRLEIRRLFRRTITKLSRIPGLPSVYPAE